MTKRMFRNSVAFLIAIVIIFLCALSVMATLSVAMASVNVDNVTFTAHYTEPATNVSGSSLKDLSHTTIYYRIGTDARIKVGDAQATSINGGGVINESFTIEDLNDKETDIIIIYTATDLSGNESAEFAEPTIRIDQLAPAAPQG